jgi:hypothetical protein
MTGTLKMGTNFGPGGLRVIVTRDPYTPVIVALRGETATFECAFQVGDVGGYELSDKQMDYLAAVEEQADRYYDQFRDIDA